MKTWSTVIIMLGLSTNLSAQEPREKVMESRAREMHRVLGLADREQWKKFIRENYSQALIDKPMRKKIQSSEDGNVTTSTEAKSGDNLEAKTGMFEHLHDDFGDSKIISIKPSGENLEMVLSGNSGSTGIFTLKFDKNTPYLIDGLGIEVRGEQ